MRKEIRNLVSRVDYRVLRLAASLYHPMLVLRYPGLSQSMQKRR